MSASLTLKTTVTQASLAEGLKAACRSKVSSVGCWVEVLLYSRPEHALNSFVVWDAAAAIYPKEPCHLGMLDCSRPVCRGPPRHGEGSRPP